MNVAKSTSQLKKSMLGILGKALFSTVCVQAIVSQCCTCGRVMALFYQKEIYFHHTID
jgi:hypothetical protein